ncbi:PHD-finger protein (macronuclear) [Tetrahymena thermophila SB210]|uniref:PHD-finger protein n=1 Tax=Tetrahymena thermophila (strain SB210) TaxID=312017 RepID=I7M4B1_TETTS|nr:PHD-finger protein [Tetrahymena thermophila SB210]EAS06140.2 PHD-finger protein [Tetrahymena thermophila SB210]|eukprot:XP_001026385.2 PHD-finger protein [Tetrahymena thermophila SB210]
MTSCYLCKNSKSKEYTVRGFFDKSKLQGQYKEIPEEVDVHISCSLLFKDTRLLQVNGNWEVRGLEEILKHQVFSCQNCKQSFDWRSRPFIINCHYNECLEMGCIQKKNRCSKHHCAFPLDLRCIYEMQVYDIFLESEEIPCKLKFLCFKHTQKRVGGGFNILQIQEQIMQKVFQNSQNPQPQSQFNYQVKQPIHQPNHLKSGEHLLGQKYDQNAYNQNQGQHYNQQKQQAIQAYGNSNVNQNKQQFNQGEMQGYQPQIIQQFPAAPQTQNPQQYVKNSSNQQKLVQTSQPISNPQFSQHQQQKLNQEYSNNQQQTYQQYDLQGRPVQIPPPSPRMTYQGGNQIPNNNQAYDQNSVIPPTQQTTVGEVAQYNSQNSAIPPVQDPYYQHSAGDQQKVTSVVPQTQPVGQYPKNQQAYRQWDSNSQQYQQQSATYNPQNPKVQYSSQPNNPTIQPIQQQNQGIYKQTSNVNQQGFNEDPMQPVNQFNQPKQFQGVQPINQDYNNGQNAYNLHQNQSTQRGFTSNYQSAQFADVGGYNNMYNNDNYGNQNSYERQDNLQQNNQQVGTAIDPVQTHDNTYSFTSNNPPARLNKQTTQEYQANTQNSNTPAQTFITNSTGRKIMHPNVDTNPNGISVDITDQIKLKQLQQQSRKAQDQQQAVQSQQGYADNLTDNSQYQKTNSTIQSTPGLAPLQAQAPPTNGDFRNLNQQQNAQPATSNKFNQKQQHYYQNQNYPNSNQYQQGMAQNQQVPYQNNQGFSNQNYQNQQFQSVPNQNFNNQGMNQQIPNQNVQQNYVNNNKNNQQNNNFSYGVQGNGSFAPIQEKPRVNLPPQRERSQQSAQSFPQNDQGNFSVPMYRRPSQQQQFIPQNQQPSLIPHTLSNQQQLINDNALPQFNQSGQQNGTLQAQENDNQMNIEEPNIQPKFIVQEPVAAVVAAPETKKRGGKRGKKDTEPQNEVAKTNDIPLKHTKSAQKKMDKKKGKKQTAMEQEEEEVVGQSNQQTHTQQMKDESSTLQQNQNQIQENNSQNIQNNNNPQQQFGSENNIANKMESQESLDFKSQTSLGIQVQRQNLQIQKDQKFNQAQYQQHVQNIQQNPSKANQFQPPPQQLTHPQPSQNIIHPPPLSKQSSMQSLPPVLENPQNPIFEHQQQIQNNQLPRHPSGSVQPSNIAAQQMNRPQNVQPFKQQIRPHQALKKKSGPLINDSYKPFFVELVEVQHQIQQYQYHERMVYQQQQQQMMMRQHQIVQGQILQNQNFMNKQIKLSQNPGSQNYGQMAPQPQLSSQNSGKFGQQNVPFLNQNPSQAQQPQIQVIPPTHPTHQQQQPPYQKVSQNVQQNLVNGTNNQQIVQGQLNQNQKVNSQNPAHHLHQQQYPQGNLVQPASQDFKNDIGSYHPQNQNQGDISKVPTEQKDYRQQFSNQNFALENLHEAPLKQNQPIQQNSYQHHPFPQPHQKNNELTNYNNNYIQNPAQNTNLPYPNQFQQGGGGQLQSNLYRDQKNQDFNNSNKKYSNNQINTGTVVTNNLNHSFNPTQNNQYYSQQSNQFSQQQYNLEKQNSIQSLQQQRSISSQQQSYNQQISSQQNLAVPSNSHPSIDQFDSNNMIKSNNISNLYHNQGAPFRNPSGANLALNATVQQTSQTQISAQQNHGVQNRHSSIQSSEQLFQGPSNTNLNLQTLTSLKTLKQIDENVENIREEDLFREEMTESEESFWDYCSPENYQHLLPQHQSSQNNQQSSSRNKSKLGGIFNNQGAAQTQQKQTKKGQAANLSSQNLQKEKDPYFGIDPAKLIVKNFPQGEDEESVFQWWDQIDEVYFPNKIKEGFFNMLEIEKSKNISEMLQSLDIVEVDENGLTKHIPPIKLIQQIQSGVTENSSLYYLIAKDYYDEEPVPFKHPNYFSVLFYNQLNSNDYTGSDNQDNSSLLLKRLQQPNNGILAVFKLKMYDKKRPLTCEDKNIFDKLVSKIEIVPQNSKPKIEDIFQKLDYSLQIQNSTEKQEHNKNKKYSKQNKDKQDLSKYEPELCKQFIGNNQIIPIQQLKQTTPAQNSNDFLFDKNKITIKLKKLISLNSSAVYSSFQATNFLNKFLKNQKSKQEKLKDENSEQDDSDSETTKEYLQAQNNNLSPIECNIFALEYELTKLQTHQQLNQLKENVFKNSKQEGNYLELRELSVKINDNLKWLTIRKNLILGFSDRQRYDSENYFKYEAEEKTGINLSRSEVLQEKEMLEKMSSTEKENLNQQQLLARQLQSLQRAKRKNQKQEEEEDEEDDDQGEEKSQFNKDKKQRSKQNDDNEDEEEDDYNDEDEDGDEEESNPIEHENKKKEELKRNSRRSNRIKRILEDENATILSNENSIDGLETVQESDRLESPSVNRNKDIDDIESDQRKVDQKNKISASSNNKKKKKQKQKNKSKFLEIDCSVCFHHVNNENNTVVYCSQCSGSFHKHCYGIDFIPEEKFLCRKCEIKNQQIMKKKNTNSCQKQPLKEEVSKQFHCKLCTETLLPVISIFDDSYFYHPTCLFLFNYAIYKDQRLQLRDTVTHTSISDDVKKQNHIACEFCHSKKGLKVKCCHFGKPRKSFEKIHTLQKQKLYKKRNCQQSQVIDSKQEFQDLEKESENGNLMLAEVKELTEISSEKKQNEIKEEDLEKSCQIKEENDIIKQEESQDEEVEYSISGEYEEDELLDEEDEDYEDLGCNYYIHPLCAFLNGFEVWLDSREEDTECEKTIVDSDFQNLQHLGLKIFFKCKEHADRKNRNYDEQVYYRRYQINYRNICQYTTFQEYQQSITKQRTQEEEQWNEIANLAKEYMENYKYYTKIKLNRKEIEISYQQQEQFYQQNPNLKEQLHQLEIEEMEEEAAEQKEQEHLMLVNQQNLQNHHSLQNVEDFYEDENIANTNNMIEEGNSLDDIDNRNVLEEELDDEYDDEEENSQYKRRSRRNLSRNQQQHNQLSGKKSNQDIQDDYQDQIENEYSQDDTKKEVNRRRVLNQKKGQQKASLISQSSLSGGTGETSKNRRSSRRLVNNNQKGKSQYSSFLNADEEEENQDSSYNQGYSSFENTLNKINLKEFSNSQPITQDKHTNQQQSSLQALTQIISEKKQSTNIEQEEEFKGISKKDQKQSQPKQKGKKGLTSKYNDDDEEDHEDEEFGIENESQDEFDDDDFDEEDADDQKYAQKRGIGKFGRNKRTKPRRNQQKYNQNEQSSSSLENMQQISNSRGASPPNKQNGALTNNQEIQKVLSTARSLAKNGKIGKGTSIFAAQNKKKKVQKKIGSRNSLLSVENDEEEEQINEIEINKEIQQQDQCNPEVNTEIIQENNCQVNQEDELTRNQEQQFIVEQQQKLQVQTETDHVQNKPQVDEKEEQQITNENTQNSNYLDVKINTQHLKRSKSPSDKNTQEQVQKQDLEGDNLKLLAQNSDNQQQANQTKYNLRQQKSKNYKHNLIKEDNDFVYAQVVNNSQFIKQQQNAFSQFVNEQGQNEEDTSSNLPQNNLQNKKKQTSQTNIPQEGTPKQKNKKNSKQPPSSQQNTNQTKKGLDPSEQEQNDESFSSCVNNNQQANNQNEQIEITNQFSLNSQHSYEETHSNEQKLTVKGKINKKKQTKAQTSSQNSRQNRKANNRNKGQAHEQEHVQTTKVNDTATPLLDHHNNQKYVQSQKNFQINNPNESQELLDFDQFEQKDQILNPNNLKYN